jgi:HEAT repeat protein
MERLIIERNDIMKTLEEKMEELANKGKTDKLVKIANTFKKPDEQYAAIAALRLVKEEASIRCLMELLKTDDDKLRRAVASTLDRIATKDVTEKLLHFSEVESDPEIKKILLGAAVNSKERTPRW